MAMTLSKIKDKISVTTIAWDDETVDVGFHPAAFTIEIAETVSEAAGENDLTVISALLEPILSWWDVLDDDGQRLPTDSVTIKTMPIGFLMEVMSGVQGAMRPPEDKD